MNTHLWIAAGVSTASIGLVVFGVLSILECLRSRSWPTVEAAIVASTVEREVDDTVSYSVKIAYRYKVGGQSYLGHQISPGWQTTYSWAWVARRAAKKYAVGSTVSAYYSPRDPKIAVLEPGMSAAPILFFGMAAVLLFVARTQLALGAVSVGM
jgi:hypothetical protein